MLTGETLFLWSSVTVLIILILASSLLFLLEGVILAAIGYPEAKTYNSDLNARVGILLMMIALSALIIMIGFRAKDSQVEQPAHMGRASSSDWIPTRLFLIGWGIGVLSAFFLVTILPYFILYHTSLKGEGFRWCYECSGLMFWTGPELSIVVSALSLAGIVVGIIMVTTKGRRTLSCKSMTVRPSPLFPS